MNRIFSVTKYEALMLLRTWKFWIPAILGFSFPVFFVVTITLVTYFIEVDVGAFYMKGTTAYILFYFFNYVIGLVIVFLCSDFFAKDKKAKVEEVINSRPISNTEYIMGKYFGVAAPLCILSIFVIVVSTIFTSIFLKTFTLIPFLKFFLIINLPTILFLTALIIFISSFIRNPAIIFIIICGIITGVIVVAAKNQFHSNKLFDLIDFGCFFLPLFPSDIIGIPNLDRIVLQRIFFIIFGMFFISLTVPMYRRLKQSRLEITIAAGITLVSFVLIAGIFKIFLNSELHRKNLQKNELYIRSKYSGINNYEPKKYNLDVKFSRNNMKMDAEAIIDLKKTTNETGKLIFSLNPGLKIEDIQINNNKYSFDRLGSAVIIGLDEKIKYEDSLKVKMVYSGKIDNDYSFIEVNNKDNGLLDKYDGPWIKGDFYDYTGENGVYLFKYTGWYPYVGILKEDDDNFFFVDLKVSLKEKLTPVTSGVQVSQQEKNGYYVYKFESVKPVKSIPLMISEFDKINYKFGDLNVNLYYYPVHDINLKFLAGIDSTIAEIINTMFETINDVTALSYPYDVLNFVEIPLQFQWYPVNGIYSNEMNNPYITILREELILKNIKERFNRIKRRNKRRRIELTVEEIKKRAFLEFADDNFFSESYWNEEKYSNLLYGLWGNRFVFKGEAKPLLDFYFINFLTSWVNQKLEERYYPDKNSWVNTWNYYNRWYFENRLDIQGDTLFSILSKTPLTEITPGNDPEKFHVVHLFKDIKVFNILKEVLGEKGFKQVISESIDKYEFDDYDLKKFEEISEKINGKNLDWFFDSFIYGASFPGYTVLSYEVYKVKGGKKGILYQNRISIKNNEDCEGFVNVIIRMKSGDKSRFVKIPGGKIAEIGVITENSPANIIVNPVYAKNRDVFSFNVSPDEKIKKEDSWEGVRIVDEFDTEKIEIVIDNLDEQFYVSKELKSKYLRPKGSEGGWKLVDDDDAFGKYVRTYYRKYAKNTNDDAKWLFNIKEEGNYEIFTYIPKGSYWKTRWMRRYVSEKFYYKITNNNLDENIQLDFNLAADGWNSLGTFYFKENDTVNVILEDKGDGRLYADAVKIVCQK